MALQTQQGRPADHGTAPHVAAATTLQVPAQATAGARHFAVTTPTSGWHVFAHVVVTTAGSGNSRGVATFRCSFCGGARHLALIALPVPQVVQRRTACGRRVTVHLAVTQ